VQVIVNGRPTEVAADASLESLLADLGLDRRWVVIERNLEPVERRLVPTTRLADGDRIELVRAVAGG
jgi:sulfur carrier protein